MYEADLEVSYLEKKKAVLQDEADKLQEECHKSKKYVVKQSCDILFLYIVLFLARK